MLEAAAAIYSEKGIDAASIQEVADKAGIGVASVYRYFPTKADLAVETAIFLWRKYMNPLQDFKKKSILENINSYMENFLRLFRNSPDFLRFIENFDNYIARQEERPENFREYEEMLTGQDQDVINLLEEGQKEGTIRKDINAQQYFSLATKSIMAFAQKLLLRGVILQSDKTDATAELKLMIEIMINSITTEV